MSPMGELAFHSMIQKGDLCSLLEQAEKEEMLAEQRKSKPLIGKLKREIDKECE